MQRTLHLFHHVSLMQHARHEGAARKNSRGGGSIEAVRELDKFKIGTRSLSHAPQTPRKLPAPQKILDPFLLHACYRHPQ